MVDTPRPIGVIYICRGKDPNFRARLERFVRSWRAHPPGHPCALYVTFKEFDDPDELLWAYGQFFGIDYYAITEYLEHNAYGGGCFQEVALDWVKEDLLCTLVSTTEIMYDDWLAKLYAAYVQPGVGLVGCTGSHEGHTHIRDTAIIVDRERYLSISKQFDFTRSKDGYLDFEHGPNNLTLQILNAGLKALVVEAHRVIEPWQWHHTTYRGNMHNVLVHDRGARDFQDL